MKSSFSIKDLENLSGIKAHTIRIWEKRYELLAPERSETNIRTYDNTNLKRLLNVAYLNHSGVKISKLAGLTEKEISDQVQDLILSGDNYDYSYNMFKLSMMNFDEILFNETYNNLLQLHSFRDIFYNTFLKLLTEIGMLWQTNTIVTVHEHFISSLIKQKILINTEKIQGIEKVVNKTFILYLPFNEFHELGLLFTHFELTLKGYKVIYLGQSVPIEDLIILQQSFDNLEYVSYITVEPSANTINSYLKEFHEKIIAKNKSKLSIIGRNVEHYDNNIEGITKFKELNHFLKEI